MAWNKGLGTIFRTKKNKMSVVLGWSGPEEAAQKM